MPYRALLVCLVIGCWVIGPGETSGCEWSNWVVADECHDPINCQGVRVDTRTRSCQSWGPDMQTRSAACDGYCKPCDAWSEWRQHTPTRFQRQSFRGSERRYRLCHLFFASVMKFFQFR
ncbi:uncharacterized protein LOC124143630 [Haliotis rufescens]|uniref:uncharacterized protein LOC124143630 n=1 Tax=Haliotis rufescens TaxID=6454 RepID=UPI00201F8AB6|nr:uncharacterized protein LOC124143630 [Haliotis rufescens]